ncbi:hypothetical protein [Roseibacillus persicicus]|uniref:hypothetical protein n=1 Tax=Roseibacillus persicicus TaxID=454148 RepID=UPI001678072E|nr:hypothetical protein [Roseibacillus persicicus]
MKIKLSKDSRETRFYQRWQGQRRDFRSLLALPPKTEIEAARELEIILGAELKLLNELKHQLEGVPLVLPPPSGALYHHNSLWANVTQAAELTNDDIALAIAQEDPNRAIENILFLLKLANRECFPCYSSLSTSRTIWLLLEGSIWELVQSQLLTSEQVGTLLKVLENPPTQEQFKRALWGEAVATIHNLETFKIHRNRINEIYSSRGFDGMSLHSYTGVPAFDAISEECEKLRHRAFPSGWFDLDKARLIQFQLNADSAWKNSEYDPRMHLSEPECLERLFFEPAQQPINFAATFFLKQKSLAAKIKVARIGLKLERHRIDHGNYPKALTELLGEDLNDPFSDGILQYRLKNDGTPHLWSVGRNQIDEEGLPGNSDVEGDIVWMLTPIHGLTKSAWRAGLIKNRIN